MSKTDRQTAIAGIFDAGKVRRKNNRALKKLQKINEELENASGRRNRFHNRHRLEKDEKVFFKEAEKRLFMLNSQSDIWADEQEKLDGLCKRRDMLFGVLKETTDQLVEELVMISMVKAAEQQNERLNYLDKVLKKNVNTLSKHLIHQTKLFDEYTERDVQSKEMMATQDSYFRELRRKLRVFNVANVTKKVKAEEERVKKAAEKNHKLEETIKILRHQAINVPLLKYQFQCAVDEDRRLQELNGELDTVIQILTDKLSDQTIWETAYQDVDNRVSNLTEIQQGHLKKFEELTEKIKVGSELKVATVSKEKSKKEGLAKRLHYFESKIHAVQKEYKSFQPKIERYMGLYSESVKSEAFPLDVAWKLTGETSKHREPEKFSDSSSGTEYEESDSTDESIDESRRKSSQSSPTLRKTSEKLAFGKHESEDESRESYSATGSSDTAAEDTSDCKTTTDCSTQSSSSGKEKWWNYFF